LERGQAFIDLGPVQESKGFDLGEIILYKDPASKFEYSYPPQANIEPEVSRLSKLVQSYCSEILKGNFDAWPELQKFREKRYSSI
jgi:hypothetical protein